ncbi:hypothetical protein H4CHR_04426 [Variovorax sp. PBS-H4]|uniref:hypothetical protein n=1 Tax=Variovorax sp. PBS-H4 TaxID=434008 RepID=UPI001316D338|nr:hypothetical protein [Variovorax sp. PBS-H4]VTU38443.1 hypothetical protein H4CHR_04426 [Variovorax sp. PBS-H4]
MTTLPLTEFDDGEVVYDSTAARAAAPAANDPPFDVDPPPSADAQPAAEQGEGKPNATALALVEVNKNIAEFDAVEAGLQKLEKDWKGVIFGDIQTPKGLRAAKAARASIREPRYAVQKAVDNAKGPLNTLKAAIAQRGEEIIERIAAVEDPIDAQVKAEEKRLQEERQRLEREAAERTKAINEALLDITSRTEACIEQPASFITETIQWLDNTELTEEDFGDRLAEAKTAWQTTRDRLVRMQAAAEAAELAAANAKILADQLKAQQDELERRTAALAKREAIANRIDGLRALPLRHVESTAAVLRQVIEALNHLQAEDFDDRISEAYGITAQVLPELQDLLTAAEEEEAEPEPQWVTPISTEPSSLEAVLDEDEAEQFAPAPAAPMEVAAPAPVPAPAPAPAPAIAPRSFGGYSSTRPSAAPRREHRPTDSQLIEVLSLHYRVHESKVIEWLLAVDLDAASKRLAAAEAGDPLPF